MYSIKVSKEFKDAFELINTNHACFLTGKAGTGKSTFLKYFINKIDKNFVVLAPTGIAAINVGGETIHSFFQFPARVLLLEDDEIKFFSRNSSKRKIISELDILIIDEISMTRADIIDAIDFSLRHNGGNKSLPFGGKKIVFVGDLFQLSPVINKKNGEKKLINEIYDSEYFYNANVFKNLKLSKIELHKVYRQQSDPKFSELLNKIRINDLNENDLVTLNSRVLSRTTLKAGLFAITLATRNSIAEQVNLFNLNSIVKKSFKYVAEISDIFDDKKYPTSLDLVLKVGAQVIFIKNDIDKRWVNGTIAKVFKLTESAIEVRLDDGQIFSVEKAIWEDTNYSFNDKTNKIEKIKNGEFKQYPLKLAWAISIHKSQGLTFENVIIDLGDGAFASGQTYVALSRVKSFKGLFLTREIEKKDIYINDEINNFLRMFDSSDKCITTQKNSSNSRIEIRLDKAKTCLIFSQDSVVNDLYFEKIGFLSINPKMNPFEILNNAKKIKWKMERLNFSGKYYLVEEL